MKPEDQEAMRKAWQNKTSGLNYYDFEEGFECGLAHRDAQPAVACSFPERDVTKPAEEQGLFRKFDVRRVDGSDAPGGKHHGCEYFVLDLNHDTHAPAALRAYAQACNKTHPQLSAELLGRFGPQPAVAVDELTAALDEYDISVLRDLAATLEFRSPSRYTALSKVVAVIESRSTPAVTLNEPTDDQLLEIAKRVIPAVEKAIGMHTAEAINKKMMDALEIARSSLNSYTPEYAMVVEAIAAAKAAKGGEDD